MINHKAREQMIDALCHEFGVEYVVTPNGTIVYNQPAGCDFNKFDRRLDEIFNLTKGDLK